MPLDFERIYRNGWRQGSVFGIPDSLRILGEHPQRPLAQLPLGETPRLIIASHSCDVVHRGESEPLVEVIPAKPLEIGARLDDLGHARNVRKLRITMTINGNHLIHEMVGPTRFTIPRVELEHISPDNTVALGRKPLRDFVYWLALRFRRHVFPDQFNHRFGDRHRRLRRVLLPAAEDIIDVLYSLHTEDELGPEESYRVKIVLLTSESIHVDADVGDRCERVESRIEEIFEGVDGIDLEDLEIRSASEMSIAESVTFDSWGFDDVSLEIDREPEID